VFRKKKSADIKVTGIENSVNVLLPSIYHVGWPKTNEFALTITKKRQEQMFKMLSLICAVFTMLKSNKSKEEFEILSILCSHSVLSNYFQIRTAISITYRLQIKQFTC
jgi:NADH:ubiquinone oxidoreductase subunit C